MKKVFLLLALALFLVGCGSQPATENLDEETKTKYVEMTKENIAKIHDGGIKTIEESFSDEMKEAFTEDSISQVEALIKKKGAFKEFGKGDGVKISDDKTKTEGTLTQQEVTYENGSIIYTINYGENDEIIGFFLK